MSKFYLIALFVTLIGVASGFRWCNETKYKLYGSSEKLEIIWVIEDIINYLVAAKHLNEANEVQRDLNPLLVADSTTEESAKEKARQTAYIALQNCDSISEGWKLDLQNQYLRAENKAQLLKLMDNLATFFDNHGAPKAAARALREKAFVRNFPNFKDAQDMVLAYYRLLY
ncbi:uncharacterized protein LOC141856008 [Brevipalpus obovatus]|uniref:uncharacterized protein LOC141856008 n=1 Tax=Brevipalpus obovatus TaxID=246614 RepID=UPI003D9ED417